MPNRILKESILSSDQINELSWFEEVLFYRLIVSADDYGCMDGRAAYLKSILFPLKENVTKQDIEKGIAKLVSTGLLIPYADKVSGNAYLFLPTWCKHQRLRNSKHRYPMPEFDENGTPISNSPQFAATCGNSPQLAADCGSRVCAYAGAESESESEIEYESEYETPYNPPLGEDAPISDPAEEVSLGKTAYTVADVVSLYNSICLSLPRVKTISDARRRQVGARMKMYSYEDFKALFTKAEASPFLKGANDHNWSADFDWLTKDRNMAKVIDGNYDGLDTRSKNKAAQNLQSTYAMLHDWAEKGGS